MPPRPKILVLSLQAPFPLFSSMTLSVDHDSFYLLVPMWERFVDVNDDPFQERDLATSISTLSSALLMAQFFFLWVPPNNLQDPLLRDFLNMQTLWWKSPSLAD